MCKDWSGGKCFFKSIESGAAVVKKIPWCGFVCELGKRNDNGEVRGMIMEE
jgi:hypothetical protein